jgi:HSP20 family protein
MSNAKTLDRAEPNRKVEQAPETAPTQGADGVYSPRVDIVETNKAFVMYAFMPGVKADDISLHCKDGQLVLHGRCLPWNTGKRIVRQEYGVGDFYRTFTLNEQVDYAKIDAKIENGVLTITLPKTEAAKPKRITVKGS